MPCQHHNVFVRGPSSLASAASAAAVQRKSTTIFVIDEDLWPMNGLPFPRTRSRYSCSFEEVVSQSIGVFLLLGETFSMQVFCYEVLYCIRAAQIYGKILDTCADQEKIIYMCITIYGVTLGISKRPRSYDTVKMEASKKEEVIWM